MATAVDDVYLNYPFNDIQKDATEKLEAHQSRDDILKMLEVHNVVIIKGATGCGKSTQVPQFILENAKEKNVRCNIVVTQPRRIAAVILATKVAEERQCVLGTLVGYQTPLNKKGNGETRILYVTTDVLLQKLTRQKDLDEFTHYIIDEIHERDQDVDFLLYMIRHFVNTNSQGARVILLSSATFDTTKFHDYLHTSYGNKKYKPGVVEIKYTSPYKEMTFHLDELCMGKNRIHEVPSLSTFDIKKPEIQPDSYRTAARIIMRFDVMESQSNLQEKGAVLVFLPGLYEIQTMEEVLRDMCSAEQLGKLWIKPLHSSITSEEQQQVFKNPPHPSQRKIILSTNIAESSVTVTDIEYVIDFCQTKVRVMDELTGCMSLELAWASRNNLVQRAGRVGRVREGRVYRMIPKSFLYQLDKDPIPEILRCPLETLVLKAKLLDMGSPEKILACTMDQPNLKNIHQAVARLKDIGALLVCTEGKYDPSDGELTWLGQVLASLPMDVHLGKLIFLGCVLGVSEECITMACAMASKNMFSTPYCEEFEAYNKKLFWADSSCSDCIAFLTAYKAYREKLTNTRDDVRQWAIDNCINYKSLKEVSELADVVKRRLKIHNLYSTRRYNSYAVEEINSTAEDHHYQPFFMKMAIAGAFYPNYFVHGQNPQFEVMKQLYSVLNDDRDPFSSVYLRGLPFGEDNKVYKSTIKKLFAKITDRLDVDTDNSSKAYVTFRKQLKEDEAEGKVPGKICIPVYKAIKMRQNGVKFSVPRLKLPDATEILKKYKKKKIIEEAERDVVERNLDEKFHSLCRRLTWPWQKASKLPQKTFEVEISRVESPTRFWIRCPLSDSVRILEDMMNKLNGDWDDSVPPEHLSLDCVYLAYYQGALRRCRIVGKNSTKNTFEILFIDWGYSLPEVSTNEIYEIPTDWKRELFIDRLPAFAVECSLVKIRPKSTKLALEENNWNHKAINILKSYENRTTIAKVYSMVDDVLRVKLVLPQRKQEKYVFKNTVNFELINFNLAERVEEDFLSVMNHKKMKVINHKGNTERDRRRNGMVRANERGKEEIDLRLSYDDLTLPANSSNLSETILEGPFSSLEIKLLGITKDTQEKPVDIERDSVNSVLLDTDPSDPKEKMLVAAYVGSNPGKDRLELKHTTVMPKLPALPMLCCLTFAPMVEMRLNTAKTKYSGALCGLGYVRETGQSLFPANDVSVVFDHEIDDHVLVLINKIRFNLNDAIDPAPKDRLSKDHLRKCGENLKKYFKQLFIENDYQLIQKEFSAERYSWNSSKNEKLVRPVKTDDGGPNHPADDFSMVHRLIWAKKML